MTIEHVRNFWHDEEGRNTLPDAAGALMVLATEPDTRQRHIEARVRRRSQDMLHQAAEEGIITAEDCDDLTSHAAQFELPPKTAQKMATSYAALAVGYVGMGRIIDASELAFYGLATHEHSTSLALLAFAYGRLAGSVANYGLTRATGKVLDLDLRLQAAVSAIPVVGPIPAMYVHTSHMVATSIPEMVPISNQLVMKRVVDKAEAWGLGRIGITTSRIQRALAYIGIET